MNEMNPADKVKRDEDYFPLSSFFSLHFLFRPRVKRDQFIHRALRPYSPLATHFSGILENWLVSIPLSFFLPRSSLVAQEDR